MSSTVPSEAFVPLLSSAEQIFTPAREQAQISGQGRTPCTREWFGYFRFDPGAASGRMIIEVGADDSVCLTLARFPDSAVNVGCESSVFDGIGTYRTASHDFGVAEAGYYYVSITCIRAGGAADALSRLTVTVNGEDMIIGSLEERFLKRLTVQLTRSSTSVGHTVIGPGASDPVAENTHCASGYVFEGELIAVFAREDGTDEKNRSYRSVRSGGRMAETSPWVEGLVRCADGTKFVMPETVPYTDRLKWPDTCCPPTATAVATETCGGLVTGYPVATPYDATSGNPDYLRTGIKIHAAQRVGTEGCISLSPEDWASLQRDMAKTRQKGNRSLPMSVEYVGIAPDPLRSPIER